MRPVAIWILACAWLASCGSTVARFPDGPTGFESREAPRESTRAAERTGDERSSDRVDAFGTYDDSAAQRLLEEKVAQALALEIQRRDDEDRRREAEVEIARARARANEAAADAYGNRYYHDVYGYRDARRGVDRSTPFPWNTLFYGGLGAVIGHQSGNG